MGDDGDSYCVEIPLKGRKTGRGRGDDGVEKGYKNGLQQRMLQPVSGVIIQQILCASYFRRSHNYFSSNNFFNSAIKVWMSLN